MLKTKILISALSLFVLGLGSMQPIFAQGPPEGDIKEMISRMDENRDGILQNNEISSRARGFIEKLKDRYHIKDNEMKIEKLVHAAEKYRKDRDRDDDRDRGRGDDRDRDSGRSYKPSIDFGEESELELAKGFDSAPPYNGPPLEKTYSREIIEYVDRMILRYDKNKNGLLDGIEWKEIRWRSPPEPSDTNHDGRLTRVELCERIAKYYADRDDDKKSSSSSSSKSSSSEKKDDGMERYRKYAMSMIKQFDKNKNGVLEKSEWERVKGNPAEFDKNRDGRLDLNEMTARMASYAKGSSSSSSSSKYSSKYTSKKSSSSSKSSEKDPLPTYRFKSPLERLPEGLPDWFTRNDSNDDGQIMMSEYSTSWSSTKVREFQNYDLNKDGVITPKECLKAMEASST